MKKPILLLLKEMINFSVGENIGVDDPIRGAGP